MILEKNQSFLQRYFPGLLEIVQQSDGLCVFDEIEVVDGRRGMPTVKVGVEGQSFFLHSQYNPVQEAERWAVSNPLPQKGIACLIGWGLGYHVLEWMKLHGKNADAVIIIEPEPKLFKESLELIDLNPLMNSSRVEIVAGCHSDRLQSSFIQFTDLILNRDVHIFLTPFAECYPQEVFQTVKSSIQQFYDSKQRMLQHMSDMGMLCQTHIIQNFPAIARALFPRDIRNLLQGEPAVIVGAGPSLDKTISQLKTIKNQVWIFAVDTSARVLMQHGIAPHFVVTKDPTDLNANHFNGLKLPDDVVVSFDPQVTPEIVKSHSGKLLCMPNRNHEVHQYLQGLELTEKDKLPLSNNVALAAFNIAVAAGCSPIIFVGLDFCFTHGASHAEGSALRSIVEMASDGASLVYQRDNLSDTVSAIQVEGVDGTMHPTTQNFYDALRLLEKLIQDHKATCIDASEGGAKIAGTQVLALKEAVNQFCQKLISTQKLSNLHPPVRNINAVQNSLLLIANHLEECEVNAAKALEYLNGEQVNVSYIRNMRATIERGFKVYHELQPALERLIVEINQPEFWNEDIHSQSELKKRYKLYFTVIKDTCSKFSQVFRQIGQL